MAHAARMHGAQGHLFGVMGGRRLRAAPEVADGDAHGLVLLPAVRASLPGGSLPVPVCERRARAMPAGQIWLAMVQLRRLEPVAVGLHAEP